MAVAFTIGLTVGGDGPPEAGSSEAGSIDAGPPEAGPPEAGSIEAVAAELAKGQAQDRAELNSNLAAAAELAHGRVGQALQELSSAVSENVVSAGAGEAEAWKRELAVAISALESVEDGTSEQTVVREAFIGAAHLLQSAADDHEYLVNGPAGEREARAATVIERRDAAVRLWQSGAAQLDTLTVGSGEGHVHLFLTPDGNPDAVPLEFQEPGTGE
ncbi:hypothetical protein GCM10027404_20650 [Arthrobacter tumbae]